MVNIDGVVNHAIVPVLRDERLDAYLDERGVRFLIDHDEFVWGMGMFAGPGYRPSLWQHYRFPAGEFQGGRGCGGEAAVKRAAVIAYVALMCGVFVFLAAESQPLKSLTIDETVYIPAGAAVARQGEYAFNAEQPPLPKLLAGGGMRNLDLVLARPFDLNAFLKENSASIEAWTLAARRPMIAIGVLTLLGVLAFAWQARGMHAGLLAITLAAMSPNLLAHGRLVTGDAPIACFAVWCGVFFLRWMERRSRWDAVGLGLAFGLALGSKFTAVLFPLLMLIGGTFGGVADADGEPVGLRLGRAAKRSAIGIGWMLLVAAPVVWVLYSLAIGTIDRSRPRDSSAVALDFGNGLNSWIYSVPARPGVLVRTAQVREPQRRGERVSAGRSPIRAGVLLSGLSVGQAAAGDSGRTRAVRRRRRPPPASHWRGEVLALAWIGDCSGSSRRATSTSGCVT